MKPGLYELVLTEALRQGVAKIDSALLQIEDLDDGDSHDILSDYLRSAIRQALHRLKGPERLKSQVELCNQILGLLPSHDSDPVEPLDDLISEPGERLLSIAEQVIPPLHYDRPDTPLAKGCILTGTRLDPSLESQIRKEILSASRIDILCSFIKWSGVRVIEEELRAFTHREGSKLRIITTSYCGATDIKAVDFLQSLPNTELRVSYDTQRTRLHAKAYAFHRDTGFGCAYIGSANLSRPALTEGLEWNVKVSQYESPHLWAKVTAAFETYWNDGEFVPYTDAERPTLVSALSSEQRAAGDSTLVANFDLRPYPFQGEILDQLAAERLVQGRKRHLVVAATGTGKTMIAAFDYRSVAEMCRGPRPKLLFVAHRKEILEQGVATFRAVLRDHNFGDLWVGEHKPESLDHLFMSIQTYNSQKMWTQVPEDYYDYVVVDEFHRAGADWYKNLLSTISPKLLLGLTATPERTDGVDVLRYFDGHMSAEIRLPDAINRKLLCPFQYFGVTDSVDLSGLRWERGGYRMDDLDKLYSHNDERANLVISKVHDALLDVCQARGLGFCVSVAHANFMATRFRESGIPSEALTGDSDKETRRSVQRRLRSRELNFIFTVDLYNEGVDIPEVDTVLFLRPTESLTVFLQQLGRGLRHSEGKDFLTILDFIGQAHKKYRFDVRYRALVDDPSRSVEHQLELGFPHLPAGCSIHIERIAKQYILKNIRQTLAGTRSYLVEEIAELSDRLERVPTLAEFLDHYRLSPDDIYRPKVSWSKLCVEASVMEPFDDKDEERLTTGLRRIQHMNSVAQLRRLRVLFDPHAPKSGRESLSDVDRRYLLMAAFCLLGKDNLPKDLSEVIERVQENPTMCGEFLQLLDYRLSHADTVSPKLEPPFLCPMDIHCLYTRDEMLAALGHWTLQQQPDMREGVLHLPQIKADLFLVTLNKTESDYSPSTMYQDYAISESLFHWQSQSTKSDTSPTGKRYIEHKQNGHTILLCVREDKSIAGLSHPYYFLGPADYESHSGSKPISFVWRLKYPMPSRILRKTARVVAS